MGWEIESAASSFLLLSLYWSITGFVCLLSRKRTKKNKLYDKETGLVIKSVCIPRKNSTNKRIPTLQTFVKHSGTFINTTKLKSIERHLGILATRTFFVHLQYKRSRWQNTKARVGPTWIFSCCCNSWTHCYELNYFRIELYRNLFGVARGNNCCITQIYKIIKSKWVYQTFDTSNDKFHTQSFLIQEDPK